jgi:hypothetical protein
MIWVQNVLITILTTLIIRSHNVGFANLERLPTRNEHVKPLTPGR